MVSRLLLLSTCVETVLAGDTVTISNEVSGCVAHPDHTDHPLDKCNSDNDPGGCTGGHDAANCYCKKRYGSGASAVSYDVSKGKDHTWSCSKSHENFCMGGCECLSKITCQMPKVKFVKFCAIEAAGCDPINKGTTIDVKVEQGYEDSHTMSEDHRREVTVAASAEVEGKLPEEAGEIGIKGKDAVSFSSVVEKSWSETHTASKKIMVKAHLQCSNEMHFYYGQTEITMEDGAYLKLSSGTYFITNHPIGGSGSRGNVACVTHYPGGSKPTDDAESDDEPTDDDTSDVIDPSEPEESEETTVPPATTQLVSTSPPVTPPPQSCQTCLTICAPCKECIEGPAGSFAFGSCQKCWSCWDYEDDELEADDASMDADCDAMHKDHDPHEEVRCLAKDAQTDCRACWASSGDNSNQHNMFV